MNSTPGLNLTATDRVLIHLRDYRHHAEDPEYPQAMSQKGISETTGLRLTHVPRALKVLEGRKLIDSAKAHVIGEKRRYMVYFLTQAGLEEANGILKLLEKQPSVQEILEGTKGPVLPVLLELAGEKVLKPKFCKTAGPIPDTEGFVNRKHELSELGEMLDNEKIRVMAIYGSQGYGASTLAAKFAGDSGKKWSVAWVQARKDLPGFLKTVLDTLGEIVPDLDKSAKSPKKLVEQLSGKSIIIVMDGYYEATDETVEFLQGLVSALKPASGIKLLVTAREDTPSYNRFYTIIDQHDGTVGEVHIRGLDMEHCQILLGTPDIDPEAMKRLFMFSRGKPPTLRLLAKGNEKELRQHTTFSPEEIKLMLFLKSQRKE